MQHGLQARAGNPLSNVFVCNAQTRMRLRLAQGLHVMGRKVDNKQPSAGSEHTRCLTQGMCGLREIVQHLMHDHGVDTAVL